MFSSTSITRATWTLRFVLAVQCAGLAAKLLWSAYETESDIYGWLYFDLGWAEEAAFRIEDIGTLIFCVCGALVVAIPLASKAFTRNARRTNMALISIEVLCLIWIMLWQGAISVLHAYRGGSFMSEWAVAAHATRIFSPAALIVLLFCENKMKKGSPGPFIADWILRLAVLATFVTHGLEAIYLNPAFIDLLIGTARNPLGWAMGQSTAHVLLYIIGAIDVVLAAALLLKRWRWIAAYLAFWGFVTACSRITAAGLIGFAAAYPETLIRAANGGAPLALCILWFGFVMDQNASRETETTSEGPQS